MVGEHILKDKKECTITNITYEQLFLDLGISVTFGPQFEPGPYYVGNKGSGEDATKIYSVMSDNNGLLASSLTFADSSRQWLKRSSVPYYVKVPLSRISRYGLFAIWDLPNVWNCIYDCSRLTTVQMREFVQGMMQHDFQEAVILDEQGVRVKACYVLEECQNLIPNSALRSYSFQEISRFVTQKPSHATWLCKEGILA